MRKLFLFLLLPTFVVAQQANWQRVEQTFQNRQRDFSNLGELSQFINQHFDDQPQQAAAIYWWVANNIRYDLGALRSQRESDQLQPQITAATFSRRKGVCEGYAGIMDSLFHLLRIPSYIISGYTRQADEVSDIPHAWVAANTGKGWYLYDPTWAAGMLDGKRFKPHFDPAYFMVSPEKMVQTHMPFDPMWQFSTKPISHRQFLSGGFKPEEHQPYFSFEDSIVAFQRLTMQEKLLAEWQRLSPYSDLHAALKSRKAFLTGNIEITQYNRQVDYMNTATNYFNRAVELYNAYVDLQSRNQGVKSAESKERLMQSAEALNKARAATGAIGKPHAELRKALSELNSSIQKLKNALEKEGVRFV